MKIAVAYLYGSNFQEIADICAPIVQKYCDRHGYDAHIKCVEKNKKGWYGFINTRYGRELLDSYELVFMTEGDLLITNLTIPITDFVDDEHDFFICKDVNGFNGGSWIVKNTEEGKDWLEFVNHFEDRYEHEQSVFEKYCYFNAIKAIPHPSINSVPYDYYHPSYASMNYKEGDIIEKPTHEQGGWEVGDFVCHLPGRSPDERVMIFNEIKEHIIYE